MPGREISNKSMQDRAYIDNLRNTGRTTQMLFRAMCAVASGKRVVAVGPNRSQVMYMQDVLHRAGLAVVKNNAPVRFVTLESLRVVANAPIPPDVRFYYDHAALDRIEIGGLDWVARSYLQARGVLAE
jgi:hypothetical protein